MSMLLTNIAFIGSLSVGIPALAATTTLINVDDAMTMSGYNVSQVGSLFMSVQEVRING